MREGVSVLVREGGSECVGILGILVLEECVFSTILCGFKMYASH